MHLELPKEMSVEADPKVMVSKAMSILGDDDAAMVFRIDHSGFMSHRVDGKGGFKRKYFVLTNKYLCFFDVRIY